MLNKYKKSVLLAMPVVLTWRVKEISMETKESIEQQ